MRHFALTILCFLLATSAKAQYQGAQLEINSTNGIYKIGDTLKVWATIFPDCNDILEFAVEERQTEIISLREVSLTEGKHLIYEEVCTNAVQYVFMLGIPGGKAGSKNTSIVGAMVAPEQCKPGFSTPDDLQEFWNKEIAKMRETPLEVKITPAPQGKKDQSDFECFDVEISMHEGNPVRGYLVYPYDAVEKSLPIVIRTHSAGVKGKWCRSSIDKTIDDALLGSGAIAFDINAHGMLNGQPQEYYDDLDAGELYKYASREFTSHEDFYFRLMYLRLVRALDYLVTLPQWEGKRVAIYGESQGGAQAAALAGIDSRITAALLRVPAFIDTGAPLEGRRRTWPPAYSLNAEEHRDILPYYDGACLLTLTKAKLFFEAGLVDYTCPAACITAGYNVAGSEDKTIVYFPYRTHTTGKMDKRFGQRWKNEVMKPRDQWLDDYLK